VLRELRYPIVIDRRNLYDPEAMAALGFTYHIGRRAATREFRTLRFKVPAETPHKLRLHLRRGTGARNLSRVPRFCNSDPGFGSAS
jgi:hypothetical protein